MTTSSSSATILRAGVDQKDIAGIYRRLAPIYDVWARLTESRARHECVERAGVRDGEDVLEVATGTGLVFRDLLRRNPSGRTVGVDLTDAMLARARTKASRFANQRWELRVGDAHALDFANASFDVLVNNYMFDLLPESDFPLVLREFHRVLRPGGRLVLVNMTEGSKFWEWLYRRNPRLMGGCRGVTLAPEVSAAGFVDVHRDTLRQLGFASEILVARKGPE